MTGATHRAGGMLVSVVGFAYLRSRGMLIPGVHEGVQWLVMYPFCMWGSVASDLDHHWDSCPSKDYPSKLVNMALHISKPIDSIMSNNLSEKERRTNIVYRIVSLFNAKHRSWQTHSDLTLFVMLMLLNGLSDGRFSSLSAVDLAVLSLVLMGLCSGIIAHFVLDMFTPEGIWSVLLCAVNSVVRLLNPKINLPKKIHLVPSSEFFATGGKWELLVRKVLKFCTFLAVAWLMGLFLFPYLPVDVSLNYGG